jgi:hypothetical protein
MAKPAITKRATKGSALTYDELDTNFQNLDDATITLQAGTGGTNVVSDLNGTITLVAGTNVTLAGNNTAKTVTINALGGDLVYDTSPQLGGQLDVNNFTITNAASTKAITLTSNSNKVLLSVGTNTGTRINSLVTDGTNSITFQNDKAQWQIFDEAAHGIVFQGATGGNAFTVNSKNVTVSVDSGGFIQLAGNKYPTTLGSANQYLKTDGAGNLSWSTISTTVDRLTSNGAALVFYDNGTSGTLSLFRSLSIATTNNGNINLVPGGSGDITLTPASGKVTISAVNFPTGDGTSGQTLVTNGSGQLSWANNSSISVTTYAGRDALDGYSDSTRPRGFTIYNSDTKTLQYWSGWTGASQGYNWQDIGNYRSVNPTTVTVDNAAITSQSAYVPYLNHSITYITWTATTLGYIELPNQQAQIGRRYTLLITKTGAGTVGFREQGVYISGAQIASGETGNFIYEIEFLGGTFNATVTRR